MLGCGEVRGDLGRGVEGVLEMSSCAHSPSERICWIVRGGEE